MVHLIHEGPKEKKEKHLIQSDFRGLSPCPSKPWSRSIGHFNSLYHCFIPFKFGIVFSSGNRRFKSFHWKGEPKAIQLKSNLMRSQCIIWYSSPHANIQLCMINRNPKLEIKFGISKVMNGKTFETDSTNSRI